MIKKKSIFKILVLYLLTCTHNKVCDIIKTAAKGGEGVIVELFAHNLFEM